MGVRVRGQGEGAGRPERSGRGAGGLIGRSAELAALRRMLAQSRLVTVVGGAGVGKSLLAEHAAAAVGSSMADGVVRVRWWDGAPPRRRTVAQTVTAAMDGGSADASAPVAELVARLRPLRMLLVLDDFDPVRGECVRLVRELLDAAPELRVLATGRHPLGLGQEAVLRLGPLEAADTDTVGPAVTLFLERLHAARRRASSPSRGRTPVPEDRTADELRLARDICRLVEGVPLAVELAAAQAARHPLARLAGMLESTQGWLGVADAPLRRHRSLRAAVGAGYELCGTVERTVWARLSVFPGGFDEDAAVYVCSGGGLEPEDVPAALARLVLASVLEPVRDPGGVLTPRYRMPAAARGFGAERLRSAGETAAAVSRHLHWYGQIASTAHHLWSTGTHKRAVVLVRDEEANLRAALDREPSGGDEASTSLALAVDLWFWWAVCGHAEEGRVVLCRLLPMARSDTRVCGQALWLSGWLAACTGSPEAAELLGQAWRVAVLAGDDATVGRVSHVLGALALEAGRTEEAIDRLREAAETIPVHAEHGPPATVSWALLAVAQAGGRPADAWRSVRRASTGPEPRHDLWTRSMTQYAQAFVDHSRGRRSRAWRRARKALAGAVGVVGAAEVPAVAAMAGPPGAELIHRLIADIEAGGR
ncbi:ATP-binding protein [Streptomyces sp. NPDC018029]|uniref:ATP-binding protein n=1 Tax=Streptomyces sp. NPDC018029 TaxID=3365032 RepID=UPI00378EEF6C